VLNVEFELADLTDADLDIREDRGHIRFRVGSHLTPQQIMDALNNGAEAVLAGGHWFQEWKGDIITAAPDPSDRHLKAAPYRDDESQPDAA
jgi:hypothetical protein